MHHAFVQQRLQVGISNHGNLTQTFSCSTENEIATVQAAGPEDVDDAVKAAHAALKHPSWKQMPVSDRGKLISRLADQLEAQRELFATIEAWDNGEFAVTSAPFSSSSSPTPGLQNTTRTNVP